MAAQNSYRWWLAAKAHRDIGSFGTVGSLDLTEGKIKESHREREQCPLL
jgi:hypothetical protein